MDNAWFIAVDTMCVAVETPTITFLNKVGKVNKLQTDLAAIGEKTLRGPADKTAPGKKAPVDKKAFLTHLRRKAHYLMLPKPIVKFVNDNNMVSISEQLPESPTEDPPRPPGEETPNRTKADAVEHREKPGGKIIGVTMHVPDACVLLAEVGRGLGRPPTGAIPRCDPSEYKVLELLYHEMTHARLYLQESDQAIKDLYEAGCAAYANPEDKDGNTFQPKEGQTIGETAFHEAAADYVQERIFRWTQAVCGLAELLRDIPDEPATKTSLAEIVRQYDETSSEYGLIRGKPIVKPKLSDALRASINEKILAGRPLTKSFNQSPELVSLYNAALTEAKKK